MSKSDGELYAAGMRPSPSDPYDESGLWWRSSIVSEIQVVFVVSVVPSDQVIVSSADPLPREHCVDVQRTRHATAVASPFSG